MKWKIAAGAAVAIVAILFLVDGMFVVKPDQFVLVTEFGDPVREIFDTVCEDDGDNHGKTTDELAADACTRWVKRPAPGLYFKMPLTQDVRVIDARVQGWYDKAEDTKTVELRTIDFKSFARWRVIDPLRFYTSARTVSRVLGGMDSIVTARIQSSIREHKLASIVRDRGREFSERAVLDLRELIAEHVECRPDRNTAIQGLLDEAEDAAKNRDRQSDDGSAPALRSKIVESIRTWANEQLEKEFGISILDLHFVELNYSRTIYDDMVEAIAKDRERDIASYRKIGEVCQGSIDQAKFRLKGEIDGEKDKEVRRILGEAAAEAIRIKREAFGTDPAFFSFIKTLEVYEKSLAGQTSMVLSTSSPLFALMNSAEVLMAIEGTGKAKEDLPDSAPTPSPTGERVVPIP